MDTYDIEAWIEVILRWTHVFAAFMANRTVLPDGQRGRVETTEAQRLAHARLQETTHTRISR